MRVYVLCDPLVPHNSAHSGTQLICKLVIMVLSLAPYFSIQRFPEFRERKYWEAVAGIILWFSYDWAFKLMLS